MPLIDIEGRGLQSQNPPRANDIPYREWLKTIQANESSLITPDALAFSGVLEPTSTWNLRHIIVFRMFLVSMILRDFVT